MKSAAAVALFASLLAASAAAQVQLPAKQDPEVVRGELGKLQRDLEARRTDADRLIDLRIRHDLGLPIDDDVELLRPAQAPTPLAAESARRQLVEEDASTASLMNRYQELKSQVDRLKTEATARAQTNRKDDEWITMPVAGAKGTQSVPDTATPPPAPGGETAPVQQPREPQPPVQVVPNLDPIRAQIDGSQDHARVAAALFKAGQALMDRADELRRQGQQAAADQCDDAARDRLQRAIEELKPSTSVGKPPFADLFQLGKCRELLFRIAERRDGLSLTKDTKEYQRREQEVRDPFVAITARDVEVKAGAEQLGIWGRAAQTAMEHFRWMNLHRGFKPRTPIESITWPGQK